MEFVHRSLGQVELLAEVADDHSGILSLIHADLLDLIPLQLDFENTDRHSAVPTRGLLVARPSSVLAVVLLLLLVHRGGAEGIVHHAVGFSLLELIVLVPLGPCRAALEELGRHGALV